MLGVTHLHAIGNNYLKYLIQPTFIAEENVTDRWMDGQNQANLWSPNRSLSIRALILITPI